MLNKGDLMKNMNQLKKVWMTLAFMLASTAFCSAAFATNIECTENLPGGTSTPMVASQTPGLYMDKQGEYGFAVSAFSSVINASIFKGSVKLANVAIPQVRLLTLSSGEVSLTCTFID
jgi:hypothetical protein